MCDDYRAAIEIDWAADEADRGRRIACPTLVAWGAGGAMGRRYDMAALWQGYGENITPAPMPGGHFFIDIAPEDTARLLAGFFSAP